MDNIEHIIKLKRMSPPQVLDFVKKCSKHDWKLLCHIACLINEGKIVLKPRDFEVFNNYKQQMLCIGSRNKNIPLYKRRQYLIKQKGSGIISILLPLIGSIVAASLK